jgi:hypothetical protein
VDCSALRTYSGVPRASVEARNGGTVLLPLLKQAPLLSFILGANSTLNLSVLTNFDGGRLAVSGGAILALPSVGSYRDTSAGTCGYYGSQWSVSGAGSKLIFAGLTSLTGNAQYSWAQLITADTGGNILLTNVTSLDGAMAVTADGAASQVVISRLASMVITASYLPSFTAQNRGYIGLGSLQSISGYGVRIISDGTSSVVDLSSLSSFATPLGASELTARNGGAILLPTNIFLLVNVAVNIAGNPVLPPVVSAGSSVSLYGRAWHSYWVEQRNTSDSASAWALFQRVPLTNDLQVISGPPEPWQAFRVWEFVADPPIVDLNRSVGGQLQLVLYGAPPKSFEVQTTNSLGLRSATWATYGTTGAMTNSFRIFPPFTPTDVKRFYRGKEL